MVFNPTCKAKIVAHDFKKFYIDGNELSFVSSFKYLGHILCNTMSDDADIKREVKNLYMRANILASLYSRCVLNLCCFSHFVCVFMIFAGGGSTLCLLCVVSIQPITVV